LNQPSNEDFLGSSKEKVHGKLIDYEFLKDQLGTSAFSLARPARVSSVTKVTVTPDMPDSA
jgi:hypothetical protein